MHNTSSMFLTPWQERERKKGGREGGKYAANIKQLTETLAPPRYFYKEKKDEKGEKGKKKGEKEG